MSPADASGMVESTRPPRGPMPPLDSQPQKPPLRPTEVEQERFARHSLEEIATRLRAGLAVAVPVALVIGTVAPVAYPEHALEASSPSLFAALVMVIGGRVASWPAVRAKAQALSGLVATAIGALAAYSAVYTGGYASPFALVLFLVWIFVMSFLPVSPAQLVPICVPPGVVFFAICGFHGLGYLPPPLLGSILLGGLAYAYFGVKIRYEADLHSFVAHRRLSRAQDELASLNNDLEGRVRSQVAEIVQRANEIEGLNKRLSVEVRNRSRELALTLERLQRKSGFHELEVGDVLADRVRIEGRLGGGGMGAVHVGTELATGQRVAVKVLASGKPSADEIRRFLAEADAAASVEHPVVVRTIAIDVNDDGRPFQILELVEGVALRTLQREGIRLSLRQVACLGLSVSEALAAAHDAGVVHRDIKPANILLCEEDPGVRLVDFGIAKRLHATRPDDPQLTMPGQLIGTPAFMAPEQLDETREVTSAVDLYSLGVLLYELAAGRPLFAVEGTPALLAAHIGQSPDQLGSVVEDCPRGLETAIMSCLRKEPSDRPTASEMASTLRELVRAMGAESLSALVAGRASDVSVAVQRVEEPGAPHAGADGEAELEADGSGARHAQAPEGDHEATLIGGRRPTT